MRWSTTVGSGQIICWMMFALLANGLHAGEVLGSPVSEWWAGHGVTDRPERRRLSIEDMIRYVNIGDPQVAGWAGGERRTADFSPDGKHATVVLSRGNPDEGVVEAVLLLYATDELLDAPRARVLARFASATNYQPITMVQWADEKTLVFFGTQGKALSQIYRLDVGSGQLQQITREIEQIEQYHLTADGRHLVAITKTPAKPHFSERKECAEAGCRFTGKTVYDLTARAWAFADWYEPGLSAAVYDLKDGERRPVARPTSADETVYVCPDWITGPVSPDARFAIQQCMMADGPAWWAEYSADRALQKRVHARQFLGVRQEYLVDLVSGAVRPLTGAPSWDGASEVVWIDESTVILAGALEPLSDSTGAERERRAGRLGVLMLDLLTGRITRLGDLERGVSAVTSVRWDKTRRLLVVNTRDNKGASLPMQAWRRDGRRWVSVKEAPAPNAESPRDVDLSIEQSPNDRSVLTAVDRKSGVRKRVLDPNGWLNEVQLGRVEEVSWSTQRERRVEGTLYYPVGYQPGTRYPVVLQTHGMRKGQFSLDGFVRIFAAQPLAAKDIMVLQIDEVSSIFRDVLSTPDEWRTVQEIVEGAVEYLNDRELIDRERVGIVGWSRTGPHAGFTMTHSSQPFAAALFIDVDDYGWWTYLSRGVHQLIEGDYGTAPFGEGLGQWMQMAPSFNLDRLRTPVMVVQGRDAPTEMFDWYAILRRLDKPIEYWSMPDGEHILFKVGELMTSNHLLVDWFDFWLTGREDPQLSKRDQYVRWRKFREQQARVLAQPRRPLLQWRSTPMTEVTSAPERKGEARERE